MTSQALDKYYWDQAGGSNYYVGTQNQRGHGLGSIFGGLVRSAIPLIKSLGKKGLRAGAKAIGNEVLGQVSKKINKGNKRKRKPRIVTTNSRTTNRIRPRRKNVSRRKFIM